jgi:acetyltransferase-like isoleucine patch superfamily enzyme
MGIFRSKPSPVEDRKEQAKGGDVFVGRYSYGAHNIRLHGANQGTQLYIGRYCSIAAYVEVFLGGGHRVDWMSTFPFGHIYQEELGTWNIPGHPHTRGDVRIGNDVWIGQGATIMSGVTIGDGAVIAANSHVVKSVPPYTLVGGNPAREIRLRFDEAIVDRLLRLRWWELPTQNVKDMVEILCAEPNAERLDSLIAETAVLPREACKWAGAK